MPEHTPGDWHANGATGRIIIASESGPVAVIPYVGPRNANRAWANAHLIAAAPELLAACKAMVDGWEHNLTEPMAMIRAAIAKAEGRNA